MKQPSLSSYIGELESIQFTDKVIIVGIYAFIVTDTQLKYIRAKHSIGCLVRVTYHGKLLQSIRGYNG